MTRAYLRSILAKERDIRALEPSFLAVDNARIAYYTAGEHGSPVLLMMGYRMPGRSWAFQIPELSQHHRVAWFDNRCAGATESPAVPYRMEHFAADAVALMDHLGWQRAHIVGVSMGGLAAQELALRHQHRALSLSLITTHPGGWFYRLPPMRGLYRMARTVFGGPKARIKAVQQLLFSPSFVKDVGEQWLTEVFQGDRKVPMGIRRQLAQLTAVIRHNPGARLAALASIPTLIIKARRDVVISPRGSDELHRRIAGSRLVEFENSGHGIIRECPKQLNSTLLGHFESVDGHGVSTGTLPAAS